MEAGIYRKTDGEESVPAFPVSCMGPARKFIDSLSANLQVAPDAVAVGVLVAGATAVQRKFVVSPWDGWTEPLSLFFMSIAESGNNKSQILENSFEKIITEYEQNVTETMAQDIADWQDEYDVLCEKTKKAKSDLAKGKGTREEVRNLRRELEQHEADKTAPCKILADDVTPQKLEELLVEPRRSSCLHIGSFLVIRKIIAEYHLDQIIEEIIGKDAGLFLDLAAYAIITENSESIL